MDELELVFAVYITFQVSVFIKRVWAAAGQIQMTLPSQHY
jgi:hypothetical protein